MAKKSVVIQKVRFYEDDLYAVIDKKTGKEYSVLSSMCKDLGLSLSAQRVKLKESKIFDGGVHLIAVQVSGQIRQVTVLERRLIHIWLLGINVNRVAMDKQDKLLRYQEECAVVLDAHFSRKRINFEHPSLLEKPVQIELSKLGNAMYAAKGGFYGCAWENKETLTAHSRDGNTTPKDFRNMASEQGIRHTSGLDAARVLEPETAAVVSFEKRLLLHGHSKEKAREAAGEIKSDLLSIHTKLANLGMRHYNDAKALL